MRRWVVYGQNNGISVHIKSTRNCDTNLPCRLSRITTGTVFLRSTRKPFKMVPIANGVLCLEDLISLYWIDLVSGLGFALDRGQQTFAVGNGKTVNRCPFGSNTTAKSKLHPYTVLYGHKTQSNARIVFTFIFNEISFLILPVLIL